MKNESLRSELRKVLSESRYSAIKSLLFWISKESNAVTETEEDKTDDGKDEAQNMDVDKVQNKESKETGEKEPENGIGEKEEKDKTEDEKEKEETKGDEDKEEAKGEEEKGEIKSERLEDESGKKPDDEAEDEVEADVDEVKAEEEEPEEHKEGKGLKKRPRTKSRSGQKDRSKKRKAEKEEPEAPIEKKAKQPKTPTKKEEEEPKTTTPYAIERPGRGTALKVIPNVAYKLSRRKTDDTFKLLHAILIGRRGKAAQVKNNISKFSGFVWPDNEEKQMIKVKEKLDKYVKEKLVEFCDVLDLQIPKANTRKEDIVAKLIEFLMVPHATTTELLAEKEQSRKGKKRKRDGTRSESATGSSLSKGSAESQKRTGSALKDGEENKRIPESEDESEEEKEEMHEEEHVDGAIEKSEEEISEHAESQEKESKSEDESVKDKGKQRRSSTKSSAKESTEKGKTKKVSLTKNASRPPKKAPAKSPSHTKYNNDTSAKKSSGKKKAEALEEKSTTPKKSASKESTGKQVVKGKGKPKEDKLKPSDNELRSATCEILKEVDFNTATFTDILKQLAKRFSTDLTARKSSIKLMIQDELTKLSDESDDDEDEGDAKMDGKQPAGRSMAAR
ncbi:DNA ligase 1-like isoform X1 [Olea europaea subsp. europaea]|uniref:DNA ligase 1-like isoform X1 n=1 Tax=Olea europaea subsp. europaea TaxID=158383 RepID=A0A8S0RR48_OLEEU|nr:DNA ligase 1-like isoform X1 [Olea europaea subsp. europaea]